MDLKCRREGVDNVHSAISPMVIHEATRSELMRLTCSYTSAKGYPIEFIDSARCVDPGNSLNLHPPRSRSLFNATAFPPGFVHFVTRQSVSGEIKLNLPTWTNYQLE